MGITKVWDEEKVEECERTTGHDFARDPSLKVYPGGDQSGPAYPIEVCRRCGLWVKGGMAMRVLAQFPDPDSERNHYQLERLLGFPDREDLQRCVNQLIEYGYLRRFYRVTAPSGVLQDFYERSDVPDEMEDTGAGREVGDHPVRFEVTFGHITVVFGRSSSLSSSSSFRTWSISAGYSSSSCQR